MSTMSDEEWALDQRRADVFERYRAKFQNSVHLMSHATEEWPAIFDLMERAMQVGIPLTDMEVWQALACARGGSDIVPIEDIILEEIGPPSVESRRDSRMTIKRANPDLSDEFLDRLYDEDSR